MSLINYPDSTSEYALWGCCALFVLSFLIQILYYLFIYGKPYSYEKKRNKNNDHQPTAGVSVIIASKNESENLLKYLPVILEQDYPDFEVIVVNMGSTDETDVALKALNQKYPNLYHTYVPAEADDINEKKLALTLAVKAARHDVLLFTEAYCYPVSPRWIRSMTEPVEKGADVVLGFCRLEVARKTPFRKFILYDNLVHGLKYLSMAIWGKPFMGLGRNLAYKKNLFFESKGFSSVLNIDGGEDDLFLNRVMKKQKLKVSVAISPESMASTDIVSNFRIWRALKSKYLHTKGYYSGISTVFFRFESMSKYLFYLSFIASVTQCIIMKDYLFLGISGFLFILRYITQLNVLNKSGKLFGVGQVWFSLLFFDVFQPFNNLKFRKYAQRRMKIRR